MAPGLTQLNNCHVFNYYLKELFLIILILPQANGIFLNNYPFLSCLLQMEPGMFTHSYYIKTLVSKKNENCLKNIFIN